MELGIIAFLLSKFGFICLLVTRLVRQRGGGMGRGEGCRLSHVGTGLFAHSLARLPAVVLRLVSVPAAGC